MSTKGQLEERAIGITIAGTLFMGALGLGVALLSGSEAALLDGVFSFISFVITILTLFVSRWLRRPADETYPFGYAVYEPILNLVKGPLIAVVCAVALASAVSAILGGGRTVPAGIITIYAVVAGVGCLAIGALMQRYARETGSPLVELDAKNWLIDGLISGAVALAFGIVFLIEDTEYAWFIPYADPAVVAGLVVLSLPIIFLIVRDNWDQVTGRGPGPALTSPVQAKVDRALESVPNRGRVLRIMRLGRPVYVQLYIVVDPQSGRSAGAADTFREALYADLRAEFPHLAMDVVFTADPVWAKRAVKAEDT